MSSQTLRQLGPAIGTAAVAVLWGTSGVLVRATTMPAAQIACGRAVIGAIVLGAWIRASPRPHRKQLLRSLSAQRGPLVMAGALLALHWLTFVMALQRIPIGVVLLGIYLAPLAVAGLARPVLGERLTLRRLMALAAAFAGGALVLRPQSTTGWGGLTLIGVSALAYAGSIVASKRALSTVGPLAVTTVQLILVGLILAPLVVLHPALVDTRDVVVLAVLGVVYSALALLAFLAFLAQLPATISGILLYLEPGSAVLAGWLFLGETPSTVTLLGAGMILAGGAIATVDNARAPDR